VADDQPCRPPIPKPRPNSATPTTVHIAKGVTADIRHGVVVARSQGSSCTPCGPAAARSTTSAHWSRTETRTQQSGPIRFVLGQLPGCASRCWPATPPRNRRPPCGGTSRIRRRAPRRRPLAGRPPPRCRTHRRPAAGCQSGPERRPAAQRTWLADPARPSAPLARAGADPVAELLTAAALPPVVHQQVRRSRDLRALAS
jgi:hypothetical protein